MRKQTKPKDLTMILN